MAGIRALLGRAGRAAPGRSGSPRSRWAPRSPPTPCSSARASRWCLRSPRGSATRCGSATRPGRDIFARRHRAARAALRRGSIEIDERVSADGEVLRPLDRDAAARGAAGGLRRRAIARVAIVLHARLALDRARGGAGRDGARDRLHPGLGEPRGQPADQADRARRHHRGRRLSVAGPAAAMSTRWRPAGRRAGCCSCSPTAG